MTDSDFARRALVILDGLRAVEEWEAENGALTEAELSTARRRVTAEAVAPRGRAPRPSIETQ